MATDSASTRISAGTPAYRRLALALVIAGLSTFALLYSVQSLLPVFARDFHVSAAESSLVVSLATGAMALMLLIASVVSGAPAAQAGLAAGDTIVSIDGHAVDSPTTLSTLMGSHHPGDKVSIGWTDTSGAQHTSTAQLASGPAA